MGGIQGLVELQEQDAFFFSEAMKKYCRGFLLQGIEAVLHLSWVFGRLQVWKGQG